MPKTRLDESRWPLVVYTASGEQTDADFDAHLADAERLLARREPYGVIFDARQGTPVNPKLRRRHVEWLRRNDVLLSQYCVALGMLVASPIQRGAFRAILWMTHLPYPFCVESAFEPARRFVLEHLTRRGCQLPPRRPLLPVGLIAGRDLRDIHSR